jgi:hypothetical protein
VLAEVFGMSVAWHNVYGLDVSPGHHSPEDARFYGCQEPTFDWIRLEEHWNGHWRRTPVGISAKDCSHAWTYEGVPTELTDVLYVNYLQLEPR